MSFVKFLSNFQDNQKYVLITPVILFQFQIFYFTTTEHHLEPFIELDDLSIAIYLYFQYLEKMLSRSSGN